MASSTQGYKTEKWAGMPMYVCSTCSFNVVGKDNLPRMEEHVQMSHPQKGDTILHDSPAGLPIDGEPQIARAAPADNNKKG